MAFKVEVYSGEIMFGKVFIHLVKVTLKTSHTDTEKPKCEYRCSGRVELSCCAVATHLSREEYNQSIKSHTLVERLPYQTVTGADLGSCLSGMVARTILSPKDQECYIRTRATFGMDRQKPEIVIVGRLEK